MRQAASSKENLKISATFWYGTQTSLLVHFLSQDFYLLYYTSFSSENQDLEAKKGYFSCIFEDKLSDSMFQYPFAVAFFPEIQ